MFDYNEIVEALKRGICRVTFTKVDGSNRVMFATLRSDLIPEEFEAEGNQSLLTEGDGEYDVVTVWDTHVDGWRRFRLDRLIEFTPPKV